MVVEGRGFEPPFVAGSALKPASPAPVKGPTPSRLPTKGAHPLRNPRSGVQILEDRDYWRCFSAGLDCQAVGTSKLGLVEGRGFEPPTPTLRTSCSPN